MSSTSPTPPPTPSPSPAPDPSAPRTTFSALAVEVLLAGRDDRISLEEAASLTGRRATPPTAAVYRDDLLALAEELLGSGASRLGTVTAAEGFVPWDLDEAGSIERLASLLEDEGDDWTYAAWFCNTERGDDIAAAV